MKTAKLIGVMRSCVREAQARADHAVVSPRESRPHGVASGRLESISVGAGFPVRRPICRRGGAGGNYDSGAAIISFASVQIQNVVQSEQKQGSRDSVKENRVDP